MRSLLVEIEGRAIVAGVDISVVQGGWACVIGPNGAGKSTLLRAVAGLQRHEGDVRLFGRRAAEMSRRELARTVALVPQRPFIPGGMAVYDYVLMGRAPYIPYFGVESQTDMGAAAAALARLEIEHLAGRPLGSLSGGEVQRVVLARALAQGAPFLLLDEPTSALDVGHQQQALELIDRLRRDGGPTVLSAMHDLTLAGQFAQTLLLMDDGRIVARGTPRDVLTQANLQRHYQASVAVVQGPDGAVLVAPVRDGSHRSGRSGVG